MSSVRRQVPPAGTPFLRRIQVSLDEDRAGEFPFCLELFSQDLDIELTSKVTFLVGENGSGKSTLLGGVAAACGFPTQGGAKDHSSGTSHVSPLTTAFRLSWMPRIHEGFFFRAETFHKFSEYIDSVGDLHRYGGGRALQAQSNGESFLALFSNRFREGVFLMDEPEAALSPQRQLALLKIIHDLEMEGRSQFLIATHSPILLHHPGARVLRIRGRTVEAVAPSDTEQVQITRDFLAHPEVYLKALLHGP